MDWTPHKTVATVVERDGRFLLVEEMADGRLVFNQPAGHVEAGESLLAAAARETLEETGWTVRITHFLGLYQYESAANGITYFRSCFIAEPVAHDPKRQLDGEIQRVVWLSPDEIRQLGPRLRSAATLLAMEDFLSGQRYPLEAVRYLPTAC